jgi:hypothetical protein
VHRTEARHVLDRNFDPDRESFGLSGIDDCDRAEGDLFFSAELALDGDPDVRIVARSAGRGEGSALIGSAEKSSDLLERTLCR